MTSALPSASDLAVLRERVAGLTWKPVPGWPYEASEDGQLRSARTGSVLRPSVTAGGYQKCTFQFNKTRREVRVHRAIAEAWIGHIPAGYVVNHLDGNKLNNRPDNLEIVTPKENVAHAVRTGLAALGDRHWVRRHPELVRRGAEGTAAKLSEDDVLRIRAALAGRVSLNRLAAEFSVSKRTIARIRDRKIWAHLT